MKIPRQPQIVSILVSCPHEGDLDDARDLLVKHLENRFDQVQSWKSKDEAAYLIKCYPRAVND